MSDSESIENSIEITAEHFRLSLAKLSQLKLPFTPTNYALIYYYISGVDTELNARLEELFEDLDNWTDEATLEIFSKFICRCNSIDKSILVPELLMIVAQIIGIVVDVSGKTSVSRDTLESKLEALAESNDPKMILSVASDIIAETRVMVDETRNFESSLQQTSQEIQSLKIKLDSARKLATSDALTGLNNRRGFDIALSDMTKKRRRKSDFCLIILDVDHFKAVNDTHGHLVGDKVLVGITKQLSNMVRGNDYLARYGGEEFAIILPDTPITGAFAVAENIRRTIDSLRLKHTTTGKKIGKVTISVGLARFVPEESAEDLVSRCDSALYKAKSLGRNRTIIAD